MPTPEARRKRFFLGIFLLLVGIGAAVTINILYTASQVQKSDQRWCRLMEPLDKRYQVLDTKDPAAVELRDNLHDFVGSLKCPKEGS